MVCASGTFLRGRWPLVGESNALVQANALVCFYENALIFNVTPPSSIWFDWLNFSFIFIVIYNWFYIENFLIRVLIGGWKIPEVLTSCSVGGRRSKRWFPLIILIYMVEFFFYSYSNLQLISHRKLSDPNVGWWLENSWNSDFLFGRKKAESMKKLLIFIDFACPHRTWSQNFRNFSITNQRSDQEVFYMKSAANYYKNKRKI